MPLPGNTTLTLQGQSVVQSKPKQAMIVRMSEEAFQALEQNQPKVEVDFNENRPVRAQRCMWRC